VTSLLKLVFISQSRPEDDESILHGGARTGELVREMLGGHGTVGIAPHICASAS
jgi:hypothetical protein